MGAGGPSARATSIQEPPPGLPPSFATHRSTRVHGEALARASPKNIWAGNACCGARGAMISVCSCAPRDAAN